MSVTLMVEKEFAAMNIAEMLQDACEWCKEDFNGNRRRVYRGNDYNRNYTYKPVELEKEIMDNIEETLKQDITNLIAYIKNLETRINRFEELIDNMLKQDLETNTIKSRLHNYNFISRSWKPLLP